MTSNPQTQQQQPSSQNDIKSLDTIRRSLLTLTTSLSSLQNTLSAPPTANAPLPPWSSLQNSFAILTGNLLALSEHLDSSRDFLTRAHAYPLPSFPGREQEALLSQLLKKKADVDVEKWMHDAEERGGGLAGGGGEGEGRPGGEEMVALWEWALREAAAGAETVPWGIDVTIEERERDGGVEVVRAESGLKRELKLRSDGEEEDDEDEDQAGGKMEVDDVAADEQTRALSGQRQQVAPMVPIEDVLRFMITGAGAENNGSAMSGALQ